jgi:hypothetical protein
VSCHPYQDSTAKYEKKSYKSQDSQIALLIGILAAVWVYREYIQPQFSQTAPGTITSEKLDAGQQRIVKAFDDKEVSEF